MSGGWTQVCYEYDGSFAGFLTCVWESLSHYEEPAAFASPEEDRLSLYPTRVVETDPETAKIMYRKLKDKCCRQAQQMVSLGFLTCLPQRECALWKFIQLALQVGSGVLYWQTDDRVATLLEAIRSMQNEAHLLKGFTRFVDCRGLLCGEISPKNRVLPLLRLHFCDRLNTETFLLYDRTHHEVLVYQKGRWVIQTVDEIQFPAQSPREEDYQRLWQKFYDTIAIEGRLNPKLRMSNVPKRYWKHMTELKDQL